MTMIMTGLHRLVRHRRSEVGSSRKRQAREMSESGRADGPSVFDCTREWRSVRGSGSDLFNRRLAGVVAALAAGLSFELDGANDDGFVQSFGHVIDGECGGRCGS